MCKEIKSFKQMHAFKISILHAFSGFEAMR